MKRGGRTRPAPRGRGRQMAGGGRTCGGMNQPPCPGGGGGYRKGGRTRPAPKRMARGGAARRPVRKMGAEAYGQNITNKNSFNDILCTRCDLFSS